MGQITSAPITGGKFSIFKMRFSAVFILVLVCALVVDAHFHQKKREKQRRRQLERQRSYYRPRTTTRYRPSYDRYDRQYYSPRRTFTTTREKLRQRLTPLLLLDPSLSLMLMLTPSTATMGTAWGTPMGMAWDTPMVRATH